MTAASIQHSTGNTAHPVRAGERIHSIDVMRGFALLGILLINITGFGLPFAAMHNPSAAGGDSGLNLGVWVATEVFANGAMFATFSMLFGAGVILFTTGKSSTTESGLTVADLYYRRSILLILFGVIHTYVMLMRGDILYSYGMVALFLFPARMMKPRTLLIAGLSIILWRGVLTLSDVNETVDLHAQAHNALAELANGGQIAEAQQQAIDAWNEIASEKTADPEAIANDIRIHNESYVTQFTEYAPESAHTQSVYFYETYFWNVLSMMLIGMGLFRLGVFSAQRSLGFYLSLMIIGYGIGGAVRGWVLANYLADMSDPLFLILRGNIYDTRLLIALGHIGLVMSVCKMGWMQWLVRRFAAAGRMALTNYFMQTVICMTFFSGLGFGKFGALERYELYYVVLGVWIVQLALSPLWLKHFRFGPAEWLWRSLTYGRVQAFCKDR